MCSAQEMLFQKSLSHSAKSIAPSNAEEPVLTTHFDHSLQKSKPLSNSCLIKPLDHENSQSRLETAQPKELTLPAERVNIEHSFNNSHFPIYHNQISRNSRFHRMTTQLRYLGMRIKGSLVVQRMQSFQLSFNKIHPSKSTGNIDLERLAERRQQRRHQLDAKLLQTRQHGIVYLASSVNTLFFSKNDTLIAVVFGVEFYSFYRNFMRRHHNLLGFFLSICWIYYLVVALIVLSGNTSPEASLSGFLNGNRELGHTNSSDLSTNNGNPFFHSGWSNPLPRWISYLGFLGLPVAIHKVLLINTQVLFHLCTMFEFIYFFVNSCIWLVSMCSNMCWDERTIVCYVSWAGILFMLTVDAQPKNASRNFVVVLLILLSAFIILGGAVSMELGWHGDSLCSNAWHIGFVDWHTRDLTLSSAICLCAIFTKLTWFLVFRPRSCVLLKTRLLRVNRPRLAEITHTDAFHKKVNRESNCSTQAPLSISARREKTSHNPQESKNTTNELMTSNVESGVKQSSTQVGHINVGPNSFVDNSVVSNVVETQSSKKHEQIFEEKNNAPTEEKKILDESRTLQASFQVEGVDASSQSRNVVHPEKATIPSDSNNLGCSIHGRNGPLSLAPLIKENNNLRKSLGTIHIKGQNPQNRIYGWQEPNSPDTFGGKPQSLLSSSVDNQSGILQEDKFSSIGEEKMLSLSNDVVHPFNPSNTETQLNESYDQYCQQQHLLVDTLNENKTAAPPSRLRPPQNPNKQEELVFNQGSALQTNKQPIRNVSIHNLHPQKSVVSQNNEPYIQRINPRPLKIKRKDGQIQRKANSLLAHQVANLQTPQASQQPALQRQISHKQEVFTNAKRTLRLNPPSNLLAFVPERDGYLLIVKRTVLATVIGENAAARYKAFFSKFYFILMFAQILFISFTSFMLIAGISFSRWASLLTFCISVFNLTQTILLSNAHAMLRLITTFEFVYLVIVATIWSLTTSDALCWNHTALVVFSCFCAYMVILTIDGRSLSEVKRTLIGGMVGCVQLLCLMISWHTGWINSGQICVRTLNIISSNRGEANHESLIIAQHDGIEFATNTLSTSLSTTMILFILKFIVGGYRKKASCVLLKVRLQPRVKSIAQINTSRFKLPKCLRR